MTSALSRLAQPVVTQLRQSFVRQLNGSPQPTVLASSTGKDRVVTSFSVPQVKERLVTFLNEDHKGKDVRLLRVSEQANSKAIQISEVEKQHYPFMTAGNFDTVLTTATDRSINTFCVHAIEIAPEAEKECTPKPYQYQWQNGEMKITALDIKVRESSADKPKLDDYAEGA
ncbi:hypothetical protein JQC92_15590 [Shewanella sp. 202IG2-18]|uniref:hypothetical protein n=1 Tax=Parashewanella hymeniacidonis TaxID=2807618 RepID=UPI001961FBB3|nr:hypothetical protein [Parashewanella hymeniacidonis]MBM7073436.1 hypothetical protein [Parashewanella hymeniacidonis]